jgi:putative ATP-binding cassette transporter
VAYAVLASGSMVFIGHRFVTVSETKNQSEAELRYVLTSLSENGEGIAVLGGEDEERDAVVSQTNRKSCQRRVDAQQRQSV